MVFLDWNMGWGANIEKAIAGINNLIESEHFIVTLQEIGESKKRTEDNL